MKESFKKIRSLLRRIQRKLKPLAGQSAADVISAPANFVPDWKSLIQAEQDLWQQIQTNSNGKKVLVATAVGGHPVVTAIESLIAMGVASRGAEVHFLLCDGVLPGCLQAQLGNFADNPQEFVEEGPSKRMCAGCVAKGSDAFAPTGLKIHYLSELLSDTQKEQAKKIAAETPLEQIGRFVYDEISVGEHALAGALRYFARGTLDGEPHGEPVLRRYFEASMLTVFAMKRLMAQQQYDCVVMNHGIYVPHGPMSEVVRQSEKRVVTWCLAYRKQCVIFSHGDTYHHTLISEPTSVWEDMQWSEDHEKQIMDYLKSRWTGANDWIWFHEHPEANPEKISAELGIDFSKPTIGLLTNVVWDAQLHYPANAFPNMLDWLTKTIEYFQTRPDLQLVIRVHPAEIRGTVPSRQLAVDEIKAAFPNLPGNVFVIPPESSASTYAVMLQCDAVIIYGTKTGLELTSLGIPVIVAGEAWIRNKGLTMDAGSQEEYFDTLNNLPLKEARLNSEKTRRARMYAFHFFFRRMIPLAMTEPTQGWPPMKVNVQNISSLLPGNDPGLDTVCSGILDGTPFVFEAEKAVQQPVAAVQ